MGSRKVFPAFLFTSGSNIVTFVLAIGKMYLIDLFQYYNAQTMCHLFPSMRWNLITPCYHSLKITSKFKHKKVEILLHAT